MFMSQEFEPFPTETEFFYMMQYHLMHASNSEANMYSQ